jgi:hypothetical protein
MTAHAITVLPVPGGATSTPRSCNIGKDLDGRLLRPGEHGRAGEFLRGAGCALIGQVQLERH